MNETITLGLKPKATNFREFNMVGCIEIANDILEYIQKLQLPYDLAMELCKKMQSDEDIQCDAWMRMAWGLAEIELFERQIRIEDPSCVTNGPDFNGGFNIPEPVPAKRPMEPANSMRPPVQPMKDHGPVFRMPEPMPIPVGLDPGMSG